MVSGCPITPEEEIILNRIERLIEKQKEDLVNLVIEKLEPGKRLVTKTYLEALEDHKERTVKILEDIAEKTYPWSDEC